MAEILLVRHGETDWNRDRRVQGHTDVPLNAAGLEQARALAQHMLDKALVAIYSSDLARARDTAFAVAQTHRLEVMLERGLREKHFGSWEGLTDTEVGSRFPEAVQGTWGDGETSDQVTERALAAITRIGDLHRDGPVLVVSHGGPIRAILRHFAVDHGPIGNCAVFRLVY